MLEVKQVNKTYPGMNGQAVKAVHDVTFTLKAGESVIVQGPSGCGKTTLLLICGGLLCPDAGQVTLDGTDIYAESSEQRAAVRGRRIGFVFQQFHLIPYLTLRDNVLAAALTHPQADTKTRVDKLLSRFDLQDRAGHRPSALSTGERQRTALARAMLNEPQIILGDEPTGNLDPDNGRIVLEALSEFAQAGGTVLTVTHDPGMAQFADRCFRMEAGHLCEVTV